MGKSTKVEKEKRVNDIYNLLLHGATRYEILQYGAKHWAIADRQIDDYISSASRLIAQESEWHRPGQLGRAIKRLEQILHAAIKDHDYGSAINAQKELDKLFSLYEPEAPKVFAIAGIDESQLKVLSQAMRNRGLEPSAIFNALLAQIAEIETDE